jgi:hypothetical protein
MAVMNPDHEAAARIALSTIRDQGFALAGGQAFNLHGFGSRPSKDVDLHTDRQTDFGQALGRLQAAFAEQGYQVEVSRQSPEFVELQLTKDGRTTQLELGRNYRSGPTIETDVGPMISVEDAVGSKVGSVYEQVEAKDYIDVYAAARSGRYTRDELLALGDAREVSGIDRGVFAEQLSAAAGIPDTQYARYGLSAEQAAAVKQHMTGWAQELRERAADSHLENSMRLLNTGRSRSGHSPAVGTTGAAAPGRSPYGKGHGTGERGS